MNDQITPDRSQVRTPGDDLARIDPPGEAPAGGRLRLWPGVALVALMWPLIILPGLLLPATMAGFMAMFWGPALFFLLVLVWWTSASRLGWADRTFVPLACVALLAGSVVLSHPHFRVIGHIIYGLPAVLTGWVAWLLVSGGLSWPARRVGLIVVFLLGWGACTLLRFDGVTGGFSGEISYRWTPTAEDRYLAELGNRQTDGTTSAKAERIDLRPGDWPGFRGPNRDGRLVGVRIGTDWQASPPKQLWRRRIGPGWSSFAVVGSRVYTQEQRGDDETVVCLDAATGEVLWAHAGATRFADAQAGPGPRATPTFHDSRIYALGANGTLNCLDAATGKRIWKANVAADSGAKVPTWGFSASPLVAHGIVSVYVGGPDGKAVLGYDAIDGKLKWSGGTGMDSYGSTQLVKLGGAEQLVVLTGYGATSLDPKSGELLWEHSWPMSKGLARCVQPAVVSGDELLIGTGFNQGTRRLKVKPTNAPPWEMEEVWTTKDVNPYYNDLVVHEGHLYGFDGLFFVCVSLEDGEKTWRQRGYASGQALLLADQGLLLIISEAGELSLVEAKPEKHTRLASLKALKGKTWNHPVVAHGKLFVRNGEEVACYELPATK